MSITETRGKRLVTCSIRHASWVTELITFPFISCDSHEWSEARYMKNDFSSSSWKFITCESNSQRDWAFLSQESERCEFPRFLYLRPGVVASSKLFSVFLLYTRWITFMFYVTQRSHWKTKFFSFHRTYSKIQPLFTASTVIQIWILVFSIKNAAKRNFDGTLSIQDPQKAMAVDPSTSFVNFISIVWKCRTLSDFRRTLLFIM